MPLEFPYQIVALLDKEPTVGEPVYYGEHGWYPQIAIKRRFKINGITEDEFDQKLRSYFESILPLTIHCNDLAKLERMPVKAIEVEQTPEIMSLHSGIIAALGDSIVSRYPERDGANYYPHVTAEYNGGDVIKSSNYTNKDFAIKALWLLKDVTDENSIAYRRYDLKESTEITPQEFINQIRANILKARKARDQLTVTTLQALLSAIDNAGAVPLPDSTINNLGAGSTEVPRRELSMQDMHELVKCEVIELQHAIEKLGDKEKTYKDELRKRIIILENYS